MALLPRTPPWDTSAEDYDNHHASMQLPAGIGGAEILDTCACAICGEARSKAAPHRPVTHSQSSQPYELVHCDAKIASCSSWGGHKLAFIFVDDFSGEKSVYLAKHRSEFPAVLERYDQEIVKPYGFNIKAFQFHRRLRMDQAGEQSSAAIKTVMGRLGISPEYSSADSSASNGVAERAIQTLESTAITMRVAGGFTPVAWGECLMAAAYLERILPQSTKGDVSAYELLHKRPPNLPHLRAIGSVAYVHDFKHGAFNPTGVKGKMIGYTPNSKMYRIRLDSGKTVNSANVTFHETVLGGSGAYWTLPGYGSQDVNAAVSAALVAED